MTTTCTLAALRDLAARALARAGASAAMAAATARALVDADAQGLASHGVVARSAVRDASCATAAPTAPRVAA